MSALEFHGRHLFVNRLKGVSDCGTEGDLFSWFMVNPDPDSDIFGVAGFRGGKTISILFKDCLLINRASQASIEEQLKICQKPMSEGDWATANLLQKRVLWANPYLTLDGKLTSCISEPEEPDSGAIPPIVNKRWNENKAFDTANFAPMWYDLLVASLCFGSDREFKSYKLEGKMDDPNFDSLKPQFSSHTFCRDITLGVISDLFTGTRSFQSAEMLLNISNDRVTRSRTSNLLGM